jgi:hypothetical protein
MMLKAIPIKETIRRSAFKADKIENIKMIPIKILSEK